MHFDVHFHLLQNNDNNPLSLKFNIIAFIILLVINTIYHETLREAHSFI